MDLDQIAAQLASTLDDRRLSRGERRALADWIDDLASDADRAAVRRRAFDLARATLMDPESHAVLDWLEDLLRLVHPETSSRPGSVPVAEAHFSPGEACPRRIISLLDASREQVEICVFTITDDRITDALLAAHARSVRLRVITDNDKSSDEGSDVNRLSDAGIPVRVDRTEFHMHHKFALFDRSLLLTGSYNWTRSAFRFNDENLVLTGDPRFLVPFTSRFEQLWEKLGPA